MNFLGLDITISSKNKEAESNRKEDIVSREECHKAMEFLGKRFEDLKDHIDTRIDDLKELIKPRR